MTINSHDWPQAQFNDHSRLRLRPAEVAQSIDTNADHYASRLVSCAEDLLSIVGDLQHEERTAAVNDFLAVAKALKAICRVRFHLELTREQQVTETGEWVEVRLNEQRLSP